MKNCAILDEKICAQGMDWTHGDGEFVTLRQELMPVAAITILGENPAPSESQPRRQAFREQTQGSPATPGSRSRRENSSERLDTTLGSRRPHSVQYITSPG